MDLVRRSATSESYKSRGCGGLLDGRDLGGIAVERIGRCRVFHFGPRNENTAIPPSPDLARLGLGPSFGIKRECEGRITAMANEGCQAPDRFEMLRSGFLVV